MDEGDTFVSRANNSYDMIQVRTYNTNFHNWAGCELGAGSYGKMTY